MKHSLCIVSDGYPYKKNSSFAFVKELVDELTRQGVNVSVIVPQSILSIVFRGEKLIPLKYQYDVNGVPVKVYRPYSLSFGGRFEKLQYLINSKVISRLILRNNLYFDAYYGHFWHSAYQLYPIAKKQGAPLFVASGESHIFLGATYKANEINEFLSYVSMVICVSSKNRDESMALGFCPTNKCVVLPNGYNENSFFPMDQKEMRKKYGFSNETFLVAFLGAFVERKGADRVSDAIKMTGAPNIRGIYIGKPQEGNTPHEPDPETVAFKGYVPHNELCELLCCADVFVLPTYQEGCCNAIVEAMACGLPIVSSDRSFNYDILDDSNSIMVEPSDVGAISNAIIKLKSDEHLRQKLREGSIKKSKSLSIEQRAKKIKGILLGDIS